MAIIKECETCGQSFEAYRANSRFCSTFCREQNYKGTKYKYKPRKSFLKTCENCGKEFVTNDRKRKFCNSDECKESNIYVKKEKESRQCESCGKEFNTSHQHKKYCSHNCYLLAKKNRG